MHDIAGGRNQEGDGRRRERERPCNFPSPPPMLLHFPFYHHHPAAAVMISSSRASVRTPCPRVASRPLLPENRRNLLPCFCMAEIARDQGRFGGGGGCRR